MRPVHVLLGGPSKRQVVTLLSTRELEEQKTWTNEKRLLWMARAGVASYRPEAEHQLAVLGKDLEAIDAERRRRWELIFGPVGAHGATR